MHHNFVAGIVTTIVAAISIGIAQLIRQMIGHAARRAGHHIAHHAARQMGHHIARHATRQVSNHIAHHAARQVANPVASPMAQLNAQTAQMSSANARNKWFLNNWKPLQAPQGPAWTTPNQPDDFEMFG